MESYERILAVGGKTNSLGRASEVVENVYADPSRLSELFECISANDPWVRMRAVDSFEKIIKNNPTWAHSYLDRILNDLTQSNQPSVQWHLAQLFSEIELTSMQRNQAVEWLKSKIETPQVDWIVSVNIMKTLLYFYEKGFIKANDLLPLFKIQETHTSKTVRKKAADFQMKINLLP